MSLEFERSDTLRPSLQRDFLILLLWVLWLMFMTALGWPPLIGVTGVGFVVLYGAWTWNWLVAAFVFLGMGWVYSAFSLTPSALFWVSTFGTYLLLKLARFRFEIRSPFQFSLAVCFATFLSEWLQLILLDRVLPGVEAPLFLFGILITRSLLQGILGYFVWGPLQRWALKT